MALESFYGGKPGFSPVIKGKFKYIDKNDLAYIADSAKQDNMLKGNRFNDEDPLKKYTMDECFKDPNYTDIWYGELCIIDADNKSNPNNGKIFRRTLKKIDDESWTNAGNTLYAEYLGQIVGPAGGVPKLHLGGLDEERKRAAGVLGTYPNDSSNLDTSAWEYTYLNDKDEVTSVNPEGDYTVIAELNASNNDSDNHIEMVPGGKVDSQGHWIEEEYKDGIKYAWCNVHRTLDGSDQDYWIYLGFQIPYTVFNIKGVEENYTYNGATFADNSEEKHPFAKDYVFHIPRGTRGIGPEEIFIINPKDSKSAKLPTGAKLYDFDSINYNQTTDTYSVNTTKIKTPSENEIYWVGKWTLYNPKTSETQSIYQYLGSYKTIKDIKLDTNGTLIFTHSDGTFTSVNSVNMIKQLWIDPRGHLLALYNSPEYRPTTGTGTDNGLYLEQIATPGSNDKYPSNQIWVKGTSNNKIAGIDTTNWWHDLGLVHEMSGVKIATSYDGKSASLNSISSTLESVYPNGRIVINGVDRSGSLVVVNNIGENNETRAFYYNYKTGKWEDLGPLNSSSEGSGDSSSSGGNSNVYITGYKANYTEADNNSWVSDNGKNIVYPLEDAENPEFYFTSSEKIALDQTDMETLRDSNSYSPGGQKFLKEIIGFGADLWTSAVLQ